MTLWRVHGQRIYMVHADIIANSTKEAEKLLYAAFKASPDGWREVEDGVITIEEPGIGLEVDRRKTRELKPHERRMGEKASPRADHT